MLFRKAYASSGSAKKSGGVTESGKRDIGGSMSTGYRNSVATPSLTKSTRNSKRGKDIGGSM